MPWEPLIDSQILAIHAALVPTDNGDGEIVYFGGDQHDAGNIASNFDASRVFNCRTGNIQYVASPATDIFCAGHAFLADGRLLVGGGTSLWSGGGGQHHDHFKGHRRCWVYNPRSRSFSEVAPMRPEPGHDDDDTGGGRWYPTLVTTGSGHVLAVSGHPMVDDTRHHNNTPERYQPITNSWTRLPPLGDDSLGFNFLYPRLHLIRTGEVFVSSKFNGIDRNVLHNPWTGTFTEVSDLPLGDYHEWNFSAALLPLLPGDSYRPRVLLCGGATPQRIRLDPADAAWSTAGTRDGAATGPRREYGCSVILPTGEVLLLGGVSTVDPEVGVRQPEIYNPAINWGNGSDSTHKDDGSDAWTTINDSVDDPGSEVPIRNYHSTALLMPDGRVWTGGSSKNADPGFPANAVLKLQMFQPPYFNLPSRPTISSCPRSVAYGQVFAVQTPQAASISRVALIRCGSSTHAFDGDQRYIGLPFTREGTILRVTAPPHGNIAPPGEYMLWIVTNDGKPCQRAKFVRVGGDMYVITDRSHFSRTEVQALQTGGAAATFYDAFYVILDGFRPEEVTPPSSVTIEFRDTQTGNLIPNADMQSQLLEQLFEGGAPTPGVGQRIVLVYSVIFPNLNAFPPADQQRQISIVARIGAHSAQGRVMLFDKKNPYMRDGQVHWLSVDLRVLQRRAGTSFRGITQGSGAAAPFDFLGSVLNLFRTWAGDPADHPFKHLETDPDASKLELSSHVGGVPAYNYAFAKVRFRAPAGIAADDVRLFFRLFTTEATSLEYRTAVYPRTGDGPDARPQFGRVGGAVASIPFFSEPRVPETDIATQPDGLNRLTLTGVGAQEVTAYFGVWLDINQAPIQTMIRGKHQCMVAEIHYIDDPIPQGATPGENDNLAQRNLAIVESDNPGNAASHIVQHTFELRPSPFWPFKKALDALAQPAAQPAAVFTHGFAKRGAPDELMIRWRNVPRDSIATIYLPQTDMDDLLSVASLRMGPGTLERVDAHTVRCRIGDVSFLPIPGGLPQNLAGLLSVQLPPTVVKGRTYRVSAHQICGVTRRIIGSFQLTIPVADGPALLDEEFRLLSVLRHIDSTITATDRWKPVFARYLGQIADRVRGFGGNPDEARPSPDGSGAGRPGERPDQPKPGKPTCQCTCCKLWAVLSALVNAVALQGKPCCDCDCCRGRAASSH